MKLRMLTALATVFILSGLSPAHAQKTPGAVPDIVSILEAAKQKQIRLSPMDISQLKQNAANAKREIKDCNNNNYHKSDGGTSTFCDLVASWLDELDFQQGELAHQRACALSTGELNRINHCSRLGAYYEQRGQLDLALEVYLRAPNCDQNYDSAGERMDCLRGAARILRQKGVASVEALVVQKLCTTFSDPMACERYNQLGGSADVQAAKSQYDAIFQAEFAARRQGQQRYEDQAELNEQSNREAEARRTALDQLYDQVVLGGPSLVDVGNQQADAIRAQADDRTQQEQRAAQEAAEQRQRASREAAAQQAQQTQQAAIQSAASSAPRSSAATSGGNAGGNSSANASQYVASIPNSCVGEFYDPQFYNWLSLQNNCGQAIHIQFTSANRGGQVWGAVSLGPGKKANTGSSQAEVTKAGGLLLYVCPDGSISVDSSNDQQVSTHAGSVAFRCKKQ